MPIPPPGVIINPGLIAQGFGTNQQLIVTQGMQPDPPAPPPSFTAVAIPVSIGPF